jgi:hypothetical protein
MRARTALLAVMALVTLSMGTVQQVRAAIQNGIELPPISAADTNDLIGRRCVVCHNAAKPLGGLNLQTFDAAKPDPAVALMMSVKVGKDGAMSAAGNPQPNQATIDEFLRVLTTYSVQNESVSGPWTVDLQVDPRTPNRGHALVIAHKRSDAGAVRLTCNGATRQLDVSPTQATKDFEGLSPTLRDLFAWCRGEASTP